MKILLFLLIHRLKLCNPLHWKKTDEFHLKGWCPVLNEVYMILKYGTTRVEVKSLPNKEVGGK